MRRLAGYRNECERRRLRAEVNNEVQIKTVGQETYHCQCSTPDPLQGAAAFLRDASLSLRSHCRLISALRIKKDENEYWTELKNSCAIANHELRIKFYLYIFTIKSILPLTGE